MNMHEVATAADRETFLQVAVGIYKNDPGWIRPLDKDIEEVFDPKKNKFFKRGSCARWILLDDAGKAIGRVAAFVNRQYTNDQPTGGIGFFECTDDQAAAGFMFDHCRSWLAERGMEAMDGPINFGERDKWWGLQTKGFQPPLYRMNYNPPYYQRLFEQYGFRPYFYQVCFSMGASDRLPEKFYHRHQEISKDPAFSARHIEKDKLDQYAADFAKVYNLAWAGHGGGKTIEEAAVKKMFRTMKPVMDEELSWFAYYNGEPVAIWINLPDLNQYFKHLDGKFGLWQKLKFLWMQQFGACPRFVGLVFGVVPQWQGKGVDSYLIIEGSRVIQERNKYEEYEMQWIGDFNPKMINIAESLGTRRSRELTTYRYLFDREKPFQRHRMLG